MKWFRDKFSGLAAFYHGIRNKYEVKLALKSLRNSDENALPQAVEALIEKLSVDSVSFPEMNTLNEEGNELITLAYMARSWRRILGSPENQGGEIEPVQAFLLRNCMDEILRRHRRLGASTKVTQAADYLARKLTGWEGPASDPPPRLEQLVMLSQFAANYLDISDRLGGPKGPGDYGHGAEALAMLRVADQGLARHPGALARIACSPDWADEIRACGLRAIIPENAPD